MKKGILVMPLDQEEFQGITHHYIVYSNCFFIYFILQKIVDVMMTQSQTVTFSHKQELMLLCIEVYRTPSHKYIRMTMTKTNATISLTQPNDVSLGCKVFKVPF